MVKVFNFFTGVYQLFGSMHYERGICKQLLMLHVIGCTIFLLLCLLYLYIGRMVVRLHQWDTEITTLITDCW